MTLFFRISLLLLFMLNYQVGAQQVVKNDTISGTPLTISMDKNIDALLSNMEENCALENARAAERASQPATRPTTRTTTPNRPLTTQEICRQNPRIQGFKIQLVVVKSNAEANEVKAYFRRRFPRIKAETDASLRPNYKVLVGSYFTKESAAADLRNIRQYFKNAITVPYNIFCLEGK